MLFKINSIDVLTLWY